MVTDGIKIIYWIKYIRKLVLLIICNRLSKILTMNNQKNKIFSIQALNKEQESLNYFNILILKFQKI
jgi:hypothetical protein